MKELDIPFNIVFDSSLEISNVSITPNMIMNNTANVDAKDCIAPAK